MANITDYPLVSVLMCCHNSEDYLAEAIESVLSQSYKQFELVAINDGSTDSTQEILSRYQSSDTRIRVFRKQNSGLTDSLNFGLERCVGSLVARLDSDDLMLSRRLEIQSQFLKINSSLDLVGSSSFEIDEYGSIVTCHKYPGDHIVLFKHLQRKKRFFAHSSAMFRMSTARKLGGYNSKFTYSQDLDFWLRIAENGKIGCLEEPLVKIRRHSKQITNMNQGKSQQLYGLAASTCHFLREMKAIDPSQEQSREEFVDFISFVKELAEARRYFDRISKWAQIRQIYFGLSGHISKLVFLTRLLFDPDFFYFLQGKIWGSNISKKIAHKWITYRRSREN